MEVRERMAAQYKVPMPAYIDLVERKVNLPFMFAEAKWIISGSNRLSDLTPYMAAYKNFSDDGIFLKGAYGPKVVEQLGYITQTLLDDNDSRQAVMTIWRERPSGSKDVPCTVAMQFLIRNKHLHLITTMRSNDVVLGFTYDVFTFSMVAKSVQLLLKQRGLDVELGDLIVQPGSLHLYETHYPDVERWTKAKDRDPAISEAVAKLAICTTYDELIETLGDLAHDSKFYPKTIKS
jgi:thymidylate synthase